MCCDTCDIMGCGQRHNPHAGISEVSDIRGSGTTAQTGTGVDRSHDVDDSNRMNYGKNDPRPPTAYTHVQESPKVIRVR